MPETGGAGPGGSSHGVGDAGNAFTAESEIPMWRKLAVPGALVFGAVGALSVYHTSSRRLASHRAIISATTANTAYANTAAAVNENNARGDGGLVSGRNGDTADDDIELSNDAIARGRDEYRQWESRSSNGGLGVDSSGSYSAPNGMIASHGRHNVIVPREDEGGLAGEFRRLSEAMEQQTGQLVEAVGAMKILASRAEQDSSSLLAARVSSHTSELRAELGTIKQLLLLQASGSGAGDANAVDKGVSAVIASTGTAGMAAAAVAAGCARSNGTAASVGRKKGKKGKEGEGGVVDAGISSTARVNGHGCGTGDARDEAARAASEVVRHAEEEQVEEKKREEEAAEAAAVAVATARRKEVARVALATLLAANAPQATKDGMAMLRMLVANLIKQPNVPRYRRIATSNDNFKKRVLPLEGHRAMMEAIGFRAKGSLWEWTWHEDSGPSASASNKTVLEDVVTAIDAAARPNGPPATPSVHTTTAPPVASLSAAAVAVATAAPSSTESKVSGSGRLSFGAPPANTIAASPRPPSTGAATTRVMAMADTNPGGTTSSTWNGGANAEIPGGGVAGVAAAAVNSNGSGRFTGNQMYTTIEYGGNSVTVGIGEGGGGSVTGIDTKGLLAVTNEANGGSDVVVAGAGGPGVAEGAGRLVAQAAEGGGRASVDRVVGTAHPTAVGVDGQTATASEVAGRDSVEKAVAANVGTKEGMEEIVSAGERQEDGTSSLPPASMAEVAAAIQRGEEPPGIRKVEDRLSADAPAFVHSASSKPSPPKPWETPTTSAASAAAIPGAAAMDARATARKNTGANGGGSASPAGWREGLGGVGYPVVDDDRPLQPSSPQLEPQSPPQAVSVGP